jgi:hypothetical protein
LPFYFADSDQLGETDVPDAPPLPPLISRSDSPSIPHQKSLYFGSTEERERDSSGQVQPDNYLVKRTPKATMYLTADGLPLKRLLLFVTVK